MRIFCEILAIFFDFLRSAPSARPHQYEVQSLVDRCTAVLESGLDVAASIERLMLADELGLGKLRAACVNFYVFSNSEFLLTLFSFPSSFLSKIIF